MISSIISGVLAIALAICPLSPNVDQYIKDNVPPSTLFDPSWRYASAYVQGTKLLRVAENLWSTLNAANKPTPELQQRIELQVEAIEYLACEVKRLNPQPSDE